MFCTKCGKENLENAKFCIACGAPISAPNVSARNQTQIRTPVPSQTPIIKPGLSKKQIKKYILEQLNQGVLKPEIENNLNASGYTYNSYKKIIYRYPELALKKKYKFINWGIIFLIVWVMLSFFINTLVMLSENNLPSVIVLLGLILPVLAIIYVIKRDRRAYFNLVGFSIYLIFDRLRSGYPLGVLPLILIMILSAFLAIKMYPEYKFIGKVWEKKKLNKL